MMSKNDLVAILAIRNVKGIGVVAIKNLWIKGFFRNKPYDETIAACLAELKKEVPSNDIGTYVNIAYEIIADCDKDGIGVTNIGSPDYPLQLVGLKDPPPVLFYKGDLSRLGRVMGVIGTREPDGIGLEVAKRVARYFHESGYAICNGLAKGIDEASLNNKSGMLSNAVGVLAGGLNYNRTKTLLKSTAILAEKVLEAGGLILSEYESSVKEDTFKVVKSCRIQAGLSQGLILIQSKLAGGSRYTLEAFCTLNRPLGIVNLPAKQKDPLYEANVAILGDYKLGLSKMTGLKAEKIFINRVSSIASKEDYLLFEKEVERMGGSKFSDVLF